MLVYFCLSSHGFGHASRQAAVINELHLIQPSWRIVVSSLVEYAFLDLALLGCPVEFRRCQWDVGVSQADALTADLKLTLLSLKELEKILPVIVERESTWILSQQEPSLIVADIPPAAELLASRVDSPLIWMGNFGWDDIYQSFDPRFEKYCEQATSAYQKGDFLLRCPFSLPMNWRLPEQTLSLVASKPKQLPSFLKRLLIQEIRTIVFLGFGGLGYQFDYNHLKRWPDFLFLLFPSRISSNIQCLNDIDNVLLLPDGVRAVDVMPFCSLHIGKPGFSSFCEALSQNLGLVVVERQDFSEAEVLINGVKLHGSHRTLTREDFQDGKWNLGAPLGKPLLTPLKTDGAFVAAKTIVEIALASNRFIS